MPSIALLFIYHFLFSGISLLPSHSAEITPKYKIQKDLFDGPYIFDKGDSLQIQWVVQGIGHDTTIAKEEAKEFREDSLPVVDLQDLSYSSSETHTYMDIDKVIALSDVHGQYDVMITLLKNHGVIDQKGKWSFGDNHLVIVGDNFDRGPKVLDILWFLFRLQKEAALENGIVHVLLGNHEIMVLNGDLRYLNKKYYYTSGVFRKRYDQLFAKGSILGDWIASHPTLVSINKKLFVHGGMSPSIIKMGYSIGEINEVFREQLIRQEQTSIVSDSTLSALYMEEGPLWYRGYFDRNEVNDNTIIDILDELDQNGIVVGHTSQKNIRSFFGNKIIAVDCSIKLGSTGQILVLQDDVFKVGEFDGTLSPLKSIIFPSLFGYIYNLKGLPTIKVDTDLKRMINKKRKEEYQPATLMITDADELRTISFTGEIRSRGNMRKQVCHLPPVKFNIPKEELINYGYDTIDKLKFVFPCRNRSSDTKYNDREFFLYQLYHLIDTNAIRAKRVQYVLNQEEKEKYKFTGFVVEDEEEYAHRKDARIVESGIIKAQGLDRPSFLKMVFFQYMIANTDWTISTKHNIEMVKLPSIDRVVALPYDFDYSGFVGQSYAVPHETLPIETVQERYFFNHKISEGEFYAMVEYYRSLEASIYELCDQATYMDKKEIEYCKRFLQGFYNLLKNPDRLKGEIIKS